MQPKDPKSIDSPSDVPSHILEGLPQNTMEKALTELVAIIQGSSDQGALSRWMQSNAWTNKYTFLNDSLTHVLHLARQFHELSRLGLEGQAQHETLKADIAVAQQRALEAAYQMKKIKDKMEPPAPRPPTKEELLARARELSAQGEIFKDIERTLIQEGRDPDVVREIIERLQYEHQKHQYPEI